MKIKQFKIVSFIFASMVLWNTSIHAQNTYDEKQLEVSLRMIGHQVLLASGDSTSRVLPLVKDHNRYRVAFEAAFEFNPEELEVIVNGVLKGTTLENNYIVEVEDEKGAVVYSYEIKDQEEANIIPCRARDQAKSKYSLLFTLSEKVETSSLNYWMLLFPFLVLIPIGFFLLRKQKEVPQIDPNIIQIGKYFFNKRSAELFIGHQKVELTSKETELLLLLHEQLNNTIERAIILKRVWGDEGDYVGRTLDVFISKLRKKLEADSNVKIVNIRGVGYKLVVGI